MIRRVFAWVIISCLGLNLVGWIVDAAWVGRQWGNHHRYFTYCIRALDNFPFWLLATLVLLVMNGVFIMNHAEVRVWFSSRGAGMPLPPFKLVGFNLLLIPALILIYAVVSNANW